MARLERAVLLLLCIFAVKFVFSTAAHFAAPLQVVDMLGSGRNPVDVWLLLLSCTAVLGTFCLYRRAARAIGAKCTKADAVILAVCIAASAAFYLHAMVGRQSLYLWDNATYYNLQVRLESNFADGVFTGVGSTIYKTWFNDYAPLVINLLAEPFFMFTPRTANTFALLCALLIPSLVYYSAWLLLTVLRRKLQPKAPVLFTALSMAFVLLLPLLHIALYRGMPDLLGVAFAFMHTPGRYSPPCASAGLPRPRWSASAYRCCRCSGASPRPTTVTATRPTRPAAFWQSWPTSVSIWAGSCLRLC